MSAHKTKTKHEIAARLTEREMLREASELSFSRFSNVSPHPNKEEIMFYLHCLGNGCDPVDPLRRVCDGNHYLNDVPVPCPVVTMNLHLERCPRCLSQVLDQVIARVWQNLAISWPGAPFIELFEEA